MKITSQVLSFFITNPVLDDYILSFRKRDLL
ncbi:hypothetical protein GIHI108528_16265 [Gillisia hiemivivida]